MTEFERLPRFVREALEGDAGSNPGVGDGLDGARLDAARLDSARHDSTRLAPGNELEFERSLLALERALGTSGGGSVADGLGLNDTVSGAGLPFAETADLDRLLQRLEGTLSKPPHRYAPFFSRTAELFDLSEDAVIAELARLADPRAWTFAGLPGIAHVTVRGGPRVQSAETLFVRFKPGVYFPRHQHTGLERVLVLEGSYEDSHGVAHVAGEMREWPSGTEHSFKVSDEPCIFASVVFGRRFYAWPLRALAKLLGK